MAIESNLIHVVKGNIYTLNVYLKKIDFPSNNFTKNLNEKLNNQKYC